MSDREAMLEMIGRFGPVATLDLLLEEIRRLRSRVDELGDDGAEVAPEPVDAPGQLRFEAIEHAA